MVRQMNAHACNCVWSANEKINKKKDLYKHVCEKEEERKRGEEERKKEMGKASQPRRKEGNTLSLCNNCKLASFFFHVCLLVVDPDRGWEVAPALRRVILTLRRMVAHGNSLDVRWEGWGFSLLPSYITW